MSATILDYGQQFHINPEDLRHLLSHSEIVRVKSNGAQVTAYLMVNGMFPRHSEVIANAHSEAAQIIWSAASDQKHSA